MAFMNEKTKEGKWQTIDPDRNIILRKIGAWVPQENISFELVVDGISSGFDAFLKTKNLPNKNMRIEWEVRNIYASALPDKNENEIKKLIEEALDVYGFASSLNRVESLGITFKLQ